MNCFRSLTATVGILLGIALPANAQTGGGALDDEFGPCTASPLACTGVNTPLNGSDSLGLVGGVNGCQGGRIVDAPADQSDAIPYCPDTNGDGIADLPPTHTEIVAAICPSPPTPDLRTSPTDTGITGLDTWYWSNGPHTASASGTIRGYPVDCTLTASRFTVDTGDIHADEFGTTRTHTTTDPGHDGPDTPITHLYERTGTYQLTLTISWTRTTTAGADTTTSATSRPYPVAEIRTVATTPARQPS